MFGAFPSGAMAAVLLSRFSYWEMGYSFLIFNFRMY